MIENYNIKRQIIIQINPLFFVNIGLSYYNQCFFYVLVYVIIKFNEIDGKDLLYEVN